jgi:hypothetical protein
MTYGSNFTDLFRRAWHCMPSRQCGQLRETIGEQRVGADQQSVGSLFHHAAEGCVDIAIGCNGVNFDVGSDGRSSRLDVGDNGLTLRVAGIDQHRKPSGSGQQFM